MIRKYFAGAFFLIFGLLSRGNADLLVSFQESNIQVYVGSNKEVCLNISQAPTTDLEVAITLDGDGAPHFTDFISPLNITFPAGEITSQCFNLSPQLDNSTVAYTFRIDGGVAGSISELVVEVAPCPGIAGPDRTVCEGETVQLGTGCLPAPHPKEGVDYCYLWEPADGLDDPAAAMPEASPTQNITYFVYVTTSEGEFIGQDDVNLTIEYPSLDVTATSLMICSGEQSTISVNGGAGLDFKWFHEGMPIDGATDGFLTVSEGGTYQVEGKAANGCTSRGEIVIGKVEGPGSLENAFEEEGFVCIDVTIDEGTSAVQNRFICNNYVEDRTNGLGFSFEGSANVITNLACLLDGFLSEANVCGNELAGLITMDDNICQQSSFFESNAATFDNTDVGFWIHFIDRPGDNDCMVIRVNTQDGIETDGVNFGVYLSQVMEVVSNDNEIYSYASKDEQILDILFHETLKVYVDTLPVTSGVAIDNTAVGNLLIFDATPYAPVGPCTHTDPVVGVSPSGMPVWVQSGARVTFNVVQKYKDKIDNEALTAFTLNEPNGYRGRFRAGVKKGCEEFVGYINQLNPSEKYQFDVQNLGQSPVKASFGSLQPLPCPLTHVLVHYENYAFDPQDADPLAIGDGSLVAAFTGRTDYVAGPDEEEAYGLYICQAGISNQAFNQPLTVNLKPHIHPPGVSDGWIFTVKNVAGGLDFIYGFFEQGSSVPTYRRYNCLGDWEPWDPPTYPELMDFLSALADVIKESGHDALDVIGLIPGAGDIADGINAIWYTAEGDYLNAAISGASVGFSFVAAFRSGSIILEYNGRPVTNAFAIIKIVLTNGSSSYRAIDAIKEIERMRDLGFSPTEASRCWNWIFNTATTSGTAGHAAVVLKMIEEGNDEAYRVWQKAAREGFSDELMLDLFKDITSNANNADPLLNILNTNPGLFKHWEDLFGAGVGQEKRVAIEVLQSMDAHLSDNTFLVKLAGGSPEAGKAHYIEIINRYAGRCSTCGNTGYQWLPETPDIYLDAIYTYTNKFAGKAGFQVPPYSNQPFSQDGFYHAMRHMNTDAVDAGKVNKIDMEFEGEGLPCGGCRFDVEMIQSSVGDLKLIEYKSYQNASNVPLPQFKNYMASISRISELKYIFNEAKISTIDAKTGIRSFINSGNNKTEIFDVIWNNQMLRNDLFPNTSDPVQAFAMFEGMIGEINNPFYNFIVAL